LSTSSASNNNLSADVTISNPISSSLFLVARNANRDNATNSRAEARKQAIYSEVSTRMGYQFVPLAIESFGRLGSKCDFFLKQVAAHTISADAQVDTTVSNALHASFIHLWKMKISCTLQKGNAKVIQMGIYRVLRSHYNFPQRHINFSSLQEHFLSAFH
jgi:hypothetical protein